MGSQSWKGSMVGQKPRLDPRRHRLIGSTAFDRWRGPLKTGDVYTSGFNPKRRTEYLTGKNGAESSYTGSRSGREADDGHQDPLTRQSGQAVLLSRDRKFRCEGVRTDHTQAIVIDAKLVLDTTPNMRPSGVRSTVWPATDDGSRWSLVHNAKHICRRRRADR